MVTFSSRLTKLRDERQINRIQLAAALGWPRLTIEKMEAGRVTPTKEQIRKMALYFGVTEAYLRGESDEPGSNSTSWLSGNLVEEEEPPVPQPVQRPQKIKQSALQEKEDSAVFNLLLKSDAFRTAVLEVLKSPEGQKLIEQAAARRK